MYEDREQKSQKLQDLTETLQRGKDTLQKQQKLTDTLIESVPVGIIMLDEHGHLSIMNENATNMLLWDKKERDKSAQNAYLERIIKENLPFEIIKKSYEPIYKVEHTLMQEGEEKLFIRVNGVPLFNPKGDFIGAVFSVIDNLSAQSIGASEDMHKSSSEDTTLLSVALIDVMSNLQSYVSDLSFLTQTLAAFSGGASQKEQLQKNINSKIDEIVTIISSNTNYYSELFRVQKSSFLPLLKHYIKTISQLFAQESISIEENIDTKYFIECAPVDTSRFLLELFLGLLLLIKSRSQSSAIVMRVIYEPLQSALIVEVEGFELKESELLTLSKSLKKRVQRASFKSIECIKIQNRSGEALCI